MTCTCRSERIRRRAIARSRWGVATVEMAIVAPILTLLLLGTLEMGLIVKNSIVLGSACREGVRRAAMGATTTEIADHVRAAAATLQSEAIAVTVEHRNLPDDVWAPLADNGSANAAPSGAQVRVTATYPHQLVTGGMFASLASPGTNTVTLSASLVMMRE